MLPNCTNGNLSSGERDGEDKDGFRKALMKEWMQMAGPITHEHTGVAFYPALQPGNDSH
jgi:hypothetical protein